jgi:hypothetical protein
MSDLQPDLNSHLGEVSYDFIAVEAAIGVSV